MALLEREPDESSEKPFEVERLPLGFSSEMLAVLDFASAAALQQGRHEVHPLDLFIGLVQGSTLIQQALRELNISPHDLIKQLKEKSNYPKGQKHKETVFTEKTFNLICAAKSAANDKGSPFIETIHLLGAFKDWNKGLVTQVINGNNNQNLDAVFFRTRRLAQKPNF